MKYVLALIVLVLALSQLWRRLRTALQKMAGTAGADRRRGAAQIMMPCDLCGGMCRKTRRFTALAAPIAAPRMLARRERAGRERRLLRPTKCPTKCPTKHATKRPRIESHPSCAGMKRNRRMKQKDRQA